MRRTVLLVVMMGTAMLLALGGVALAALSNTADPSVQANGRVWDILRDPSRDTIYLAGAFTQVTDKDGSTVARNGLAAVDAGTGRLTAWNPSATNPANPATSSVRSMALSSDGSRLFVGGTFTRVGGQARARLAAVDPATGAVDPNWKASVDRPVLALAASGGRLYLGGDFATVAGQPRGQLAAVDQATGAPDPLWTPKAHRVDGNLRDDVRALEVSEDGSRVYAGGFFNHLTADNVTTKTGKLVALSAVTGSPAPGFRLGYPNDVLALDVSATGGLGERVYVGAGDPLEGVEALDASTGQLAWSVPGGHPDPEAGDVQAVVASGGKVYAGGHYAQMGGLVRKRLVEVDASTGQIGPWAPQIPGNETGNLGVWAVEADPARGRLYAGGDFLKVSGNDRQRFAQFSGL